MRLKIVSPLNRERDIDSLIDAGADELYTGLLDAGQLKRYKSFLGLNRRPEFFSNLNSVRELKRAVAAAHKRGVFFSFALNEYYNDGQLRLALGQADDALECGVDALLVSDIGLIAALKKRHKEAQLHLSSCANVFNAASAGFYVDLGVSRIVMHRHLTVEEIKALRQRFPAQMETEVFVLNERCYNVDGYCSFQHGKFTARLSSSLQRGINGAIKKGFRFLPGSLLQAANRRIVKNDHVCCYDFLDEDGKNTVFNTPDTFLYACGVCALFDFHAAGVSHVKISGRSVFTDQVRNVRAVRQIADLLNGKTAKEDFLRAAREAVRSRQMACGVEFCYYSSYR